VELADTPVVKAEAGGHVGSYTHLDIQNYTAIPSATATEFNPYLTKQDQITVFLILS